MTDPRLDPAYRLCAVCGRTLSVVEHASGRVSWRHEVADRPADHPAVPVSYTEAAAQHRPRCDFCSEEDPRWVLPAESFMYDALPGYGSSDAWAACERCAALIRAGNWIGLRARALAAQLRLGKYPRSEARQVSEALDELLGKLREHVTGPPYLLSGSEPPRVEEDA